MSDQPKPEGVEERAESLRLLLESFIRVNRPWYDGAEKAIARALRRERMLAELKTLRWLLSYAKEFSPCGAIKIADGQAFVLEQALAESTEEKP